VSDRDSYLEKYEYYEKYAHYEELFNPLATDRKARRRRKAEARHVPKKPTHEIIAELADETAGLEGGFETTYHPSRVEKEWLFSSLRSFYDRGLITDVLNQIKGGKEASVYRCAADPATGVTQLAAKVYRPRQFRNLRNDSMYRQGRQILDAYGRDHEFARDKRVAKAVSQGTSFGSQVRHTSWLMHEYTAMERLHEAGAAVPQPIAAGENAILMTYFGDNGVAAPTLNTVDLTRDESGPLFREVLRNVDLMLQQDLIHGDLSAYNILYWEGEVVLIDFPQVADLHNNTNAYFILRRDLQRICEYFSDQGVECDAADLMGELWHEYGYGDE
jgi:RIO kinase 1